LQSTVGETRRNDVYRPKPLKRVVLNSADSLRRRPDCGNM
jgi:hypothetical protein